MTFLRICAIIYVDNTTVIVRLKEGKMTYFYNLAAREMLSSMDDPMKICNLYEYGLLSHNPILAICVQNELARRGDTDLIRCTLDTFIQKDETFECNSSFAKILGKSLLEFKHIDPVLHYIGRKMLQLGVNEDIKDPVDKSVEDEATIVSLLKELMSKYHYHEQDFYEIAQNVFDSIS